VRGDIVPPDRNEPKRTYARPSGGSSPVNPTKSATAPVDVTDRASTPTSAPKEPVDIQTADIKLDDIKHGETSKRSLWQRKWLIVLTSLLAVVVVAVISGFVWYGQQLSAVDPKSDERVKITIDQGSDVATIANVLKRNDLIRSESAFGLYIRLQGKAGLLQSGAYRLSKSEDVPRIVGHLTSGNTDTFSLTFLPGATLTKHRQVLIDAGYSAEQVDAAFDKTYSHPLFDGKPAESDLEGYIYGETYNFPADATPEQILVRIFDEYDSVIKQNNLVELYKQQGFTLYQGITMASIIQREVATPEDAAQVAQVFKLRYDQGMQLGSDVTYQYIADKTGQPRSVDLDSPYNTRRYVGLPPGPISSPGLAALKAVGTPAPGDYIYFLSGDDDKTYFARTNAEHEQNIRDHCQKKCQII